MGESRMEDLGTLVWIGDQDEPEFQEAFQYCVSRVAQVALRSNLQDAICRPAACVRYVLLARTTRRPIDERLMNRLVALYPQASVISLLGTLCEGMRLADDCPVARDESRLYWHRWNQILPQWLGGCSGEEDPAADHRGSVAVLASTFREGEPLLELAQSAGSTAVWCRGADAWRVRNVDLVWWDDSVAPPTSSRHWRRRLEAFGDGQRQTRHAWIANSPRYHQQRQAIDGGIELIVSKPNRVGCLLAMLTQQHHVERVGGIGLKAA